MDSDLTIIQDSAITTERTPASDKPALVYLAGLGNDRSRRVMAHSLNVIAHLLTSGKEDALTIPWAAVRRRHVQLVRSRLAEHYKPASANRMLSALRGVLKASWDLGQMDAETYARAVDVEAVKGSTLPAGRSLAPGELAALLDTCATDVGRAGRLGARDAAVIAVLYCCGLRRAELVGLDLADYDPKAGTLKVRHGKGNKQRLCHLVDGCTAALADWLAIRGGDPGPLFWPLRKGGHLVQGRRLATQTVYDLLQARILQAGIETLSPHDFRRTFVGDLLDAGADIATVQRMAGHANVTTTARYDRRPEDAKRKAAGLLHVPYRRRRLT